MYYRMVPIRQDIHLEYGENFRYISWTRIGSCKKKNLRARTWKQPRCSSIDEWIELWAVCVCVCVCVRVCVYVYICIMEYYSAIKRKAFESVLVRWMKLEPIKQNEISLIEKKNIIH